MNALTRHWKEKKYFPEIWNRLSIDANAKLLLIQLVRRVFIISHVWYKIIKISIKFFSFNCEMIKPMIFVKVIAFVLVQCLQGATSSEYVIKFNFYFWGIVLKIFFQAYNRDWIEVSAYWATIRMQGYKFPSEKCQSQCYGWGDWTRDRQILRYYAKGYFESGFFKNSEICGK